MLAPCSILDFCHIVASTSKCRPWSVGKFLLVDTSVVTRTSSWPQAWMTLLHVDSGRRVASSRCVVDT